MSALELERAETPADTDREKMVHWIDPKRGFPWAACGFRCSEWRTGGEPLECVVCAELLEEYLSSFRPT